MKKLDWWERRVWLAFAILGCISLVVFLGTIAYRYWQNKTFDDFWDLSTAVFAFFGTLMTAGAAFATVAAVISYLSVNDKLREARSSLDKFSEIDQQRKQLENNIAEMKEYEATLQDLERHDATEDDQSSSIAAAQQILQSPHADFESRLKARAIVQTEEIRQKFGEIEVSPSEDKWTELIASCSDISAAWKMLLLSAPQDAERHRRNYSASLFNQAVAIQLYGYWLQKNHMLHVLEKWREASEKYALALNFDPNNHQAAYNWGYVLAEEARILATQDLPEARRLWREAGEKCARALEIKPDKHEAAYNWGDILAEEARVLAAQDLPEARRLWREAGEKYARVLEIKSDKHEVLNNWGIALCIEARVVAAQNLSEARRLWREAYKKYELALKLKPDNYDSAICWGIALDEEARALAAQNLPEARRLWREAGGKYAHALEIKPDMHEAANNWGNALNEEAQALAARDLSEAKRLWHEADEKYARALEIKPDKHEAANNWGNVLDEEARALAAQNLPEARRLWREAGEKYVRALEIKPDKHEAAHNWWIGLQKEASYLAAEEQAAFWQEKREQVLALQKVSPAHQESAVIQDLLEKIENQINPET